ALRAAPGLLGAHGVGHVGREGRPAEPARRRRLLLRVEPLAVLVLRGDDDGAGGAGGGDAVAADRAVLGQEVDVVAQGLEVVGSPVAADATLVVQVRLLLVRLHGEVAAEATRRPRGVAGEAAHLVVGVRELGRIGGRVAPGAAVRLHRLGQARLLAVARVAGRHRVHDLRDFPLDVFVHHRPLGDLAAAAGEARLAPGRAEPREVHAGRGGAGRGQVGRTRDRAVTVDAVDLDGRARLAVELAVAVHVLLEVAVHAVHPLLQVDVLHVDGLLPLVGVDVLDRLARLVEEPALAI